MANKLVFVITAIVLSLTSIRGYAQDIDFEKVFDDFQTNQQIEFDDFKNKADAEFEVFLRETWTKFDASAPELPIERPEPIKQPILDQTIPDAAPVEIKPALSPLVDKPIPGIYKPGQPYVSVKIAKPTVPVLPTAMPRRTINFYATPYDITTFAVEDIRLTGNKEGDVADAWAKLCKANHESLIEDCMTLRESKRLSDWAYIQLTKTIGQQLYGVSNTNEVAFLQMFILSKSGYKVRLAKINEKLKLMIAPAGSLYGMPFVVIDGTKYYIYDAEKVSGSMGVYTYKQDFANALNYISLEMNQLPELAHEPIDRSINLSDGKVLLQAVVNKNLIDFYKDYPQCNVDVYYRTPMSVELKSAIYPILQQAIDGKNQEDAANALIEFVQSGFEYLTDGEQFGYEKPFFIDENFFYPACDCEDRSILYATLVKDLLGLEVVLLDYPNHIATAVCFTDDIQGDYIILDDTDKYLICDPTYIGASIGRCMPNFKNVSPEIIR